MALDKFGEASAQVVIDKFKHYHADSCGSAAWWNRTVRMWIVREWPSRAQQPLPFPPFDINGKRKSGRRGIRLQALTEDEAMSELKKLASRIRGADSQAGKLQLIEDAGEVIGKYEWNNDRARQGAIGWI